MANFFSLQDGNLTDASTYGYSLTGAEIMNNTTGVSVPGNVITHTPIFISDGSNINGVALHLSSIQPYTSDTISLKANITTNENAIIDVTNNSLITNNSAYVVTDTPFDPNMSGSFTTSTSYISIPTNSQTAFRNNNFTIEFWYLSYNPSENQTRPIYVNYNTGFAANNIFIGKNTLNSGKMTVLIGSISISSPVLSAPDAFPSGWNHWAITRNNNTFTLYQNGSSVAAYTHGSSISATAATNLGSIGYNGSNTNGIISNFRIVNDTCLYTTTFTPSATSLTNITNTALLTLQNGVAKDNSSNNISLTANKVTFINNSPLSTNDYSPTVNGGSIYLPLSSYLQVPVSNYTKFSTTPFTFELWFKTNIQSDNVCLFSNQNGSTGTSIVLNKRYYGPVIYSCDAAPSVTTNSLHPTPELSSYRLPSGSYLATNPYSNSSLHPFGADGTGNFSIQWWGYVPSGQTGLTRSNCIAWTTANYGIRVYFIVQSDTSKCYLSIQVANSAGTGWQYSIGTNIQVTYNTWQHYSVIRNGNTINIYQNGTSKWNFNLSQPSIFCGPDGFGYHPSFAPGYAGGTTQCVAYISGLQMVSEVLPETVPTSPYVVIPSTVCLLTAPYDFTYKQYTNYSMVGRLDVYNGATSIHTLSAASNNYLDSKWHHLALTRDSNGSKIFIDGYQQGDTNATQGSTNFDGSAQAPWYIGKSTSSNIDNIATYSPYVGYVSNIRALTGRSLYTGNFTPSSTVFNNISSTSLLINNTNNIGYKTKTNLGNYNISSFSNYNGSNNLLTNYPQNWQIVKFNTPLSSSSGEVINFELSVSNDYQLSLMSAPLKLTDGSVNNLSSYLVGNAFLTSFKPNTNFTNSVFVSGYNNYLSIPTNSNLDFSYKDFTIECWFNSISSQADGTIFSRWGDGSNDFALFTRIASSNALLLYMNNALLITGPTISYNTWYHVAVVRTNSVITLYLNGIPVDKPYHIGSTSIYNGNTSVYLGRRGDVNSGMIGYINDFRITNGSAIYKSKFTTPTQASSIDVNTVFLLKSVLNSNKAVLKQNTLTPTSLDTIHIGGSLTGINIEPRTVTAATSTFQNLYIHNQGTLNFPLTSSKTLTLNGSAGLQITSDGTLNIGTSSASIPLSTTHTIVLSNTQIDVHNGGNLNVYGYPKLFVTNLVSDYAAGTNTFTTTDPISSIWNVGDTLTFKPNLTSRTSFDTLTIASFTGANTLSTTSNSLFFHTGSATYANIAGVYNLNRNVKIQGLNSTARGTIRTIDEAKTSVNYAQLSNFGINATNKTGFVLGNNSSGITTLSSIVINSDNNSTVNNITPLTGRTFQNVNIINNIINKANTIVLSSLNISNVNISNNYILSSGGIALQISNSNGSINMSNNTTIGSLSYGTYLFNNTLTGTYGANNFNSSAQGMYIVGTNTGIIVGGGLNSAKEGVYVDASTSNLSGLTFQNILANNNSSVGFKVSGNSLNYSSPVTLNVNGLTASSNNTYGVEAYNIKGNLSSLTINNNLGGGIRTSIGHGYITFDGLSSTTSGTCLNILSAYNYYDTTIKNSYLSSNSICLILDSTRFGKFSIENSTLSSSTPIQLNTTRNLLEGSYLFNNNYMGNISFVDLTKYQANVYKNLGFAFMSHNNLSGNHFSYIPGGTKVRDTVVYDPSTTDDVSERLTPITFNTKLRSSSKFVAINSGDLTNIRVNVLVVSSYNGNPPRLILKRNPSAGVYSDMVLKSYDMTLGYNEFFELVGTSPYVIDNSILEFYVDCDGTSGYICVDTWYAN